MSDTESLERIEASLTSRYPNGITGSEIIEETDYLELEFSVEASTVDEAGRLASMEIVETIRSHTEFDEEDHTETVLPSGDGPDDPKYTVIVRERL